MASQESAVKYVLAYICVLGFQVHYASQAKYLHREPCKEGWAWKDKFENEFHKQMYDEMELFRSQLVNMIYKKAQNDVPKNICVARFAFVVKNSSKKVQWYSVKKLNNSFKDGFTDEGIIASHVFFSGKNRVKMNGSNNLEQIESAKKDLLRNQSETPDKRKKKKQGGGKNNPDVGKPFESYNKSAYKYDINAKLVVIHSRSYGPEKRMENLFLLYHSCDTTTGNLTIARLARNYVMTRLAPDDKATYLKWAHRANMPGPFHVGAQGKDNENKAVAESNRVFYTQNEDSEQKLLQYLNAITHCLQGFDLLMKLATKLLEGLKSKLPYFNRCFDKKLFMDKFENIEKMNYLDDNVVQSESIDKMIQFVESSDIKPLTDKQFQEYLSFIHECFSDLHSLHKYLIEQQELCPFSSHNLRCIKKDTAVVETILRDVSENLLKSKLECARIIEIDKQLRDIIDICGKDVHQKLVLDFDKAVDACIQNGNTITEIVLYIHNTYDGCYSCSSDIAQELRRKGFFVEYFKNAVQKKNKDYSEPKFTIKVSCAFKRDGTAADCPSTKTLWCQECDSPPQNDDDDNDIDDDPHIKYFQYYVPSSNVQENIISGAVQLQNMTIDDDF